MKKIGKIITIMAIVMVLGLMPAVLVSCRDDRERLYLFNWGYFMDMDTVREFEREYNIRVIPDTYDSNEAMHALITGTGASFDVIVPSDYMISKMMREDLLRQLDKSLIPNLRYIDSTIMEKSEYFDPGNLYAVPYKWGTVGILYNPERVEGTVESWNVLWDERSARQIIMYDSMRDSIGITLRKLGYSLNTTNSAELQRATEALQAQRPLVMAYMTDDVHQAMIANQAWLATVYSGCAVYIMSENDRLNFAIPEEGTNLFIDAMVIPRNARNPEAAHKFINFMNRPEIALRNSMISGYSTANAGAFELLDEEWQNNPVYWPLEFVKANPDKFEVFRDLGDFTVEYERAWTQVRGR